jgi:ketosteroid isomerase-like protein
MPIQNPGEPMRKMLVFVGLVLVSSIGWAQGRSDAENKLTALENAWSAAQRDHDVKAIEALIVETFINTEWDGSVQNKAQFLQGIKDTSVKLTTMTNDDMTVFIYGNTAIVAGAYHAKGTRNGKPYEARGRFTDTWVQTSGKWMCVASAAQHIKN